LTIYREHGSVVTTDTRGGSMNCELCGDEVRPDEAYTLVGDKPWETGPRRHWPACPKDADEWVDEAVVRHDPDFESIY
jgi:hypothetical protein